MNALDQSAVETRPDSATRQRRADASRSIDAIITATLVDSEAPMSKIARIAGVSRTTLYAHFPTRQQLLAAAVDRAILEAGDLLPELSIHNEPASEVMARLLRSSWQSIHRYGNLYSVAATTLPPSSLRSLHEPLFDRVDELIARGQAQHHFRTDLPRNWLISTIYSLMHLAADELSAGRRTADDAGELVTTTVQAVLAHRSQ
jgi:TetR/AcrR family transcriptional regulator, mexCD-oprJ operon repressor